MIDLQQRVSSAWGGITGTLADQTDLGTALGLRLLTSSLGANVNTALGVAIGSAGAVVVNNVANTLSVAGATSVPGLSLTGVIFTGGTGTTTFPHLLIQPTGATASTTWNTSGTAFGINLNVDAGNIFDFAIDGASKFTLASGANSSLTWSGGTNSPSIFVSNGNLAFGFFLTNAVAAITSGNFCFAINGGGADSALAFSSGDPSNTGTHDTFLRRKSAAVLQLGMDAAGVTNQMFTAANRITSDGVGANLTIAAGNGRGAAGGSLILSTFTTAGAATAGTLTSRLTIDTAGVVAWNSLTASADAAVVSTHTARMTFNGTEYKVMLSTV